MVGGWSHSRHKTPPHVECPACKATGRDSQGLECKLCVGLGMVSQMKANEFEQVSTDRQSEAAGEGDARP